MSGADTYRGIGWEHGSLVVQRQAAMLAPLTFVLRDGRQVSPMHIAPWAGTPDEAGLPGILRRLRGEWPCVPFGYAVNDPTAPPDWARFNGPSEPGEEIHGHSSNWPWTWDAAEPGSLALFIDYPDASPVKRLRRTIAPDASSPAVTISLAIETRADCLLPLGLHPTFRLPARPGGARVEPGRFAEGRTFPGTVEPSAPLFAIDRGFSSLSSVPLRSGGTLDAAAVPLPVATEELLQLNGIDTVSLANLDENYRVTMTWDAAVFPSLLMWYSNRGRQAAPWNGRHLALGLEPICSPFGLGPASARANNPMAASGVATARRFRAGEVLTTTYRIAADILTP